MKRLNLPGPHFILKNKTKFMIRKQHFLFLLAALLLILMIWIPSWHFSLGLTSETDNPMKFQLRGYSLIVEQEIDSSIFSFDGLKPSIWYLNTFGIAIYIGCLLITFLHLNRKGNRNELLIQKRWGYLSLAGGAITFVFLFLQIHQILRQLNTILGTSARYIGETTNGDLSLLSQPDSYGLGIMTGAIVLNLAAIWFIQSDIKKIDSSSRLR